MTKKESSVCVNCVCLAICLSKTTKRLMRDCKNPSAVIAVNSMDGSLVTTHLYGLDRNVCCENIGDGTVVIRGIDMFND